MKALPAILLCLAGLCSPLWAATGADTCAAPAAQAQVVDDIAGALRNTGGHHYDRVVLEPMAMVPAVRNPRLEIKGAWPASYLALQLGWTDCNTGMEKTGLYWFKAHAYREAWVYGRSQGADQSVMTAIPTQQQIDVAALQLNDEELADDLQGMVTARPVNAGRPAVRADLAAMPLVRRNDAVAVVVAGNGVLVHSHGTAMANGSAGTVIPIVIEGSTASIRAMVMAQGEVYVQP